MESSGHNLTEATKQKTYLTKVVKEYALIMEMPVDHLIWNHLVIKCSFCLNSSFNKNGSLVSSRAWFFVIALSMTTNLIVGLEEVVMKQA